jgi:hypothetical protein
MATERVTYYGRAFFGNDYTDYTMVKIGNYVNTLRGQSYAINKIISMFPDAWTWEVECSDNFREAYRAYIQENV